jgi:hypothetical protein
MSAHTAGDSKITVRVPAELPALTRESARILTVILVELTEVPILDKPQRDGTDDC